MRVHDCWCGIGVLALLSVAGAARAAGIDCSAARDAVAATICASPRLVQLDSELARTYADALARDTAHRETLRHDERNWLAERDRSTMQWLGYAPGVAAGVTRALARQYEDRVAFLRDLDNPDVVRGHPLARAVLALAPALPSGKSDVLNTLRVAGLLSLPPPIGVTGARDAIGVLPAPPDAALRQALDRDADNGFVFEYLKPYGLGGFVSADTDLDCRHWIVFREVGNRSRNVALPDSFGGCWKSQDHLARFDGQPVAIHQTIDPFTRQVDLVWTRWLDGKWGPLVRVRIRFDHGLATGYASCAPSADCVPLTAAAMRYARRYDERPVPQTLERGASLTPAEGLAFQQMVDAAKRAQARESELFSGGPADPGLGQERQRQQQLRAIQASGADVVPDFEPPAEDLQLRPFSARDPYFPVRIDGELLLGRIGSIRYGGNHGQNYYGFDWLVGFWRWQDRKLVPLAGFEIRRPLGQALLAAVVPAREP